MSSYYFFVLLLLFQAALTCLFVATFQAGKVATQAGKSDATEEPSQTEKEGPSQSRKDRLVNEKNRLRASVRRKVGLLWLNDERANEKKMDAASDVMFLREFDSTNALKRENILVEIQHYQQLHSTYKQKIDEELKILKETLAALDKAHDEDVEFFSCVMDQQYLSFCQMANLVRSTASPQPVLFSALFRPPNGIRTAMQAE